MGKNKLFFLACSFALTACKFSHSDNLDQSLKIEGTWRLISATTVDHGKSIITDFTKDQQMIKIVNKSHFSFLRHNLPGNIDSVSRFDAGGGRYELKGDAYTEHLDFYQDKNWEGKTFNFKIRFEGDTLIQTGTEKVPESGIDRVITERYLKL